MDVTGLASLRAAEKLLDGSFRVTLQGAPPCPNAMEASDGLRTWMLVRTETLVADGTLRFIGVVPSGLGQRFYPARLVGAP